MKEEELLLIKEQLSKAKWSKYGLMLFGVIIAIFGIIATYSFIYGIIFVQFGIIYCMIAQLTYGRDYREKLKELKTKTQK